MTSRSAARPDATIGQRIAQARRELGVEEHRDITQSDLAERLGVSQATVNRWEGDVEGKQPRDENVIALAKVLGVTPGWLRYGQEPKHPPLDTIKHPISKSLPNNTTAPPKKRRSNE